MKEGIKETKEMIEGLMELSLLMAEQFKDGIDATDFFAIMMKVQGDERYKKAFEGMKEIPIEAKDIDMQEGMELAMMVMKYVPKFIDAMKKKP